MILALALALPGCLGNLDDGGTGPAGGRRRDTVCAVSAPGDAPLRRITEEQWQATVDALFGEGTSDGIAFPRAIYRRGYRTDGEIGEVSRDGAVALADAASAIAERVVASDLNGLLGCAPGPASDDACVTGWIDTFGAEAFRRPLREEERATFRALYAALRTSEMLTESESVTGVIEAVLASPQMNYLSSDLSAAEGNVIRLDDHAVAERLSYFLWNEPPDEVLRAAADEGRLNTRDQVELEARRMADDPRAARMLGGFVEDWLEIHRVRGMSKDRATYPAWSMGLSEAVMREHYAFVDEVMLRGDRRLSTLLSANYAVVDPQLAELYGTTETSGRASLGPERRGLLNLSGFLAGHSGSSESAPVLRGVTVIRQLFCEEMELPAGLNVTSPPQDPTRTTRERFTAHRAEAACARCHDRIDPVGFAFEDFDAVGGHRDTDTNGLTIDASGHLADLSGALDEEVDGGANVAEVLATSPVVQACFARQVLNYAEGRVLSATRADAAVDDCALSQINARFTAADGDVRELLVAIATSDVFLSRRTD